MARKNYTRWARPLVQALFFALIVFKTLQHMLGNKGAMATLDGLCPFGALETLGSLVSGGKFLSKLAPSNIILGVGLLLATLIAGNVFCGWVCPLGTLGDLLTALRGKLGIGEVRLSGRVDRIARYFRYVVLALVLLATYYFGSLVFADYDPYRTIFGLHWIFEPGEMALAGIIITGLTIIAMFLIPRAWCRYACPLGGALSLVGRLRVLRIQREASKCIQCDKCNKACHVGLDIQGKQQPDAMCTGCLKCVEECPKKGALSVAVARKPLVSGRWLPLAGVGVLIAAIGLSMATGLWISSQRQVMQKQSAAGTLAPEDIKGWMTFNEVSEVFGIPVNELLAAAGSPAGFSGTSELRGLESLGGGLDVDVIRQFVAEYGKAAKASESNDALPKSSAPAGSVNQAPSTKTTEPGQAEASPSTEPEVKGYMTLMDISVQFGIPLDNILSGMGLPPDVDVRAAVRDLKGIYGFEMQTLRDLVEKLRTK